MGTTILIDVVPRGDYFVSKTGNDTTGNGSQSLPWLTIGKAATSMTAGKTVMIGAGTYDERVTIASSKSGTDGAHTRLYADGAVIVTQGFEVNSSYTDLIGFEVTPGAASGLVPNVDYRGQVYVKNHHVRLANMNFHDLVGGAAVCLGCSSPVANYATVVDCVFEDLPWNAVSVDNGGSGVHASDVTVLGCTVRRFGGYQGIKAYGDRWLIEGCTIRGPSLSDFQQSSVYDGDGISINYAAGTVIRRVDIYDIWSYKGYDSGEHADCIQFWDSVTNLTIDACTLGSWKAGGLDNSPGPTNAIMYGTCTTNCDVTVQNTVFLCGISATGNERHTHLGAAAANTGYTVTIRLFNNTFFGNYPYNNGSNTSLICRNNVFYSHRGSYSAGDDSDYNGFLWNDWSDASFTGLQASSVWASEGAHSLGTTVGTKLVAADIFEDPDVTVTTNYGLTADFSPKGALLGAGVGYATDSRVPRYDHDGKARSTSAPSIGAFE